jgi:hypothetical protein
MSTQRRVARWQRVFNTELAGTENPSSRDAGASGPQKQFRRVATGRTASSLSPQYGRFDLATNSPGFGSRCKWRLRHGLNESRSAAASFLRQAGTSGSFPAIPELRAGFLPEQLPLISPLLSGASGQENQFSARIAQSALPQVPTGICPGTERQHGQGNLYLEHATRNAACHFGRRPTL